MRSNSGLLPALISDPEGKKKVYLLVDNLSAAAVSLAKVTHDLETGKGALPILLHDEEFGRAFTQNLKTFSEQLESIGRKLDEGQGTAGKLINDPALFDAANRLVVGVDQSALLRWLIKDRQKAAIKTEYDAAKKTAAASATPTPGATAEVRFVKAARHGRSRIHRLAPPPTVSSPGATGRWSSTTSTTSTIRPSSART